MTAYTKQTWLNGMAGSTPINAARLNYMEDGIEAASRVNILSAGVDVDAAIAINAAITQGGFIYITGTHVYSSQLVFNTPDTHIILTPGAQLLKHVEFSTLYSIQVSAPRVTFENFRQDGQRLTAVNQTYGMVFVSGATDCAMINSSVRSNKFHGVQVEVGAEVDFYNTDISDNVHSPGAGYGLLGFGVVNTYGNCTFDSNGYIGCYTGISSLAPHIEGSATLNGSRGFSFQGAGGFADVQAADNRNIDVALDYAYGWDVKASSTDAGKTAMDDGIGVELMGSAGCTVNAKVTRPRGFGAVIARRSEQPTLTITTDAGTTPITLSAATTSLATAGAAVIENEYITWSGKSGNDITGVTRGQRASTPATHAAGRDLLVLPSTTFTADPGAGGTTWNVGSTAAFTSEGWAWSGDEIISYTDKTATSLLNVRRGQLNTTAATHAIGQVVAPILESHHNTITLDYDGYGSPDGDPGVQISGGSSDNVIHATIRNALVPVSIGEEPWPKNNDRNEIWLYADNCVYGGIIITGGNHNRIRKAVFVDCWTFDAAIADALLYFDDQRANLSAYGFGTVIGNKVDDYEIRTISAPAPTNRFSQKNTASLNTAECHLTGTLVWDPPSVPDNAATTTTFTITGARVGDICTIAFSTYVTAGAFMIAHVYADDSILVALYNRSGGALDLASGTVRVDVHKFGA